MLLTRNPEGRVCQRRCKNTRTFGEDVVVCYTQILLMKSPTYKRSNDRHSSGRPNPDRSASLFVSMDESGVAVVYKGSLIFLCLYYTTT